MARSIKNYFRAMQRQCTYEIAEDTNSEIDDPREQVIKHIKMAGWGRWAPCALTARPGTTGTHVYRHDVTRL